MKARFVLMLALALPGVGACFVPTYQVDSTSSSGGTSALAAGAANTTGGANDKGGSSSSTAGAATGATGAGGDATGAGGAPMRVGFSVFHDSASGSDQASSKLTDATFTKPAGTAPGDLMLVFFGCDHALKNLTGSTLSDAGWTLQDQHEGYGDDGQGTYLLYRIVDGTEPEKIVFADINEPGSGNGVQGLLSVYRGVNQDAPINAYEVVVKGMGSDGVTHIVTDTPAITTTADDCLLIAGLSPDTAVDAPKVSKWPDGFDENQVTVSNPPTPYPYGWANIYSAERRAGKAGLVPGSAFEWDMTYDGTQYYGSLTFVLALAP